MVEEQEPSVNLPSDPSEHAELIRKALEAGSGDIERGMSALDGCPPTKEGIKTLLLLLNRPPREPDLTGDELKKRFDDLLSQVKFAFINYNPGISHVKDQQYYDRFSKLKTPAKIEMVSKQVYQMINKVLILELHPKSRPKTDVPMIFCTLLAGIRVLAPSQIGKKKGRKIPPMYPHNYPSYSSLPVYSVLAERFRMACHSRSRRMASLLRSKKKGHGSRTYNFTTDDALEWVVPYSIKYGDLPSQTFDEAWQNNSMFYSETKMNLPIVDAWKRRSNMSDRPTQSLVVNFGTEKGVLPMEEIIEKVPPLFKKKLEQRFREKGHMDWNGKEDGSH